MSVPYLAHFALKDAPFSKEIGASLSAKCAR